MKTIRIASLVTAVLMIFAFVGCGKDNIPSEEVVYTSVISTVEGENDASNNQESGTQTSSTQTSSTPSGNGGSLTWEQVKAKIPSGSSGKND